MKKYLAAELAAAFLFVMAAIWCLPTSWAYGVGIPLVTSLLVLGWWVRPTDQDKPYIEHLGIQPEDFSQTGRMLLAVTVSLAAMIGLAYLLCPHFADRPGFWVKVFNQFKGYLLWAFAQQLLLQGYFSNRLEALCGKRWLAALASGSLFALAHLPNPVLVPATAIFGAAGTWFFLRSRNLYLMTVFHALLGTATKYLLANPLLPHGMRVGPGFWN